MASRGLDLCYHQGNIDWKKVKADGIDFIIPRDGWGVDCEGKQVDPKFLQNVKEAQEAGISVPGVYHFIYSINDEETIKNAQNAISNVEKAGLPKSTIIWCDLEYDTVDSAKNYRGVDLSPAEQKHMAELFCDTVLAAGYATGLYVNQDYLRRVYGLDIINKYDVWLADLEGDPFCKCLYRQVNWRGQIAGIPTYVDVDEYYGQYTAGTAKPQTTETKQSGGEKVGKVDSYISALKTLGDGRYHYWDGRPNGIGCSEYTRLALVKAGIIKEGETFHAASGIPGPLADTKRFQKIAWSANNLQAGDILWSSGYHVATWDGKNGVYEAAPENTHGICDNGKTGVGHWSNHTYRNCGNGTKNWTCIYRIVDTVIEKTQVELSKNIQALAGAMPIIKQNSKGEIVTVLQTELKRIGYYTDKIDGIAGPNTVKAIKALQTNWNKTDKSIVIDGIFGPMSWNKLLKK